MVDCILGLMRWSQMIDIVDDQKYYVCACVWVFVIDGYYYSDLYI